jgi:magnesium-transporting ATPase (P-type)
MNTSFQRHEFCVWDGPPMMSFVPAGQKAFGEIPEFERGLRRFGMLTTRAVLFLVLVILVVRVATHKNAFESFVFAVALAVALTPEFLPMITSVTLGRAAIRMARHNVIANICPPFRISVRLTALGCCCHHHGPG